MNRVVKIASEASSNVSKRMILTKVRSALANPKFAFPEDWKLRVEKGNQLYIEAQKPCLQTALAASKALNTGAIIFRRPSSSTLSQANPATPRLARKVVLNNHTRQDIKFHQYIAIHVMVSKLRLPDAENSTRRAHVFLATSGMPGKCSVPIVICIHTQFCNIMDGVAVRRYQVRKHQVIGGCTLCCLLAPVIVLFIVVGWPAGVISTSVYLCVFAMLIHYLRKPVEVMEVYEPFNSGGSYQQAPPPYGAHGARAAHDTAILV